MENKTQRNLIIRSVVIAAVTLVLLVVAVFAWFVPTNTSQDTGVDVITKYGTVKVFSYKASAYSPAVNLDEPNNFEEITSVNPDRSSQLVPGTSVYYKLVIDMTDPRTNGGSQKDYNMYIDLKDLTWGTGIFEHYRYNILAAEGVDLGSYATEEEKAAAVEKAIADDAYSVYSKFIFRLYEVDTATQKFTLTESYDANMFTTYKSEAYPLSHRVLKYRIPAGTKEMSLVFAYNLSNKFDMPQPEFETGDPDAADLPPFPSAEPEYDPNGDYATEEERELHKRYYLHNLGRVLEAQNTSSPLFTVGRLQIALN